MYSNANSLTIFRCEGTVEGIFTAIYDAWASKLPVENTRFEPIDPSSPESYTLFADYIDVTTDTEKAMKVSRSISGKLSDEVFQYVLACAFSCRPERADAIYLFLRKAFKLGKKVLSAYGDPDVMKLFEIWREVTNEAHYYIEFIRFEKTDDGAWLGKISPKNNVASYLIPHFRDRFPDDILIIFDTARRLAVLSRPGSEPVIALLSDDQAEVLEATTEEEDYFKTLWKVYHKHIAIEERTNYALQRNLCRIRFRKYMTEFNP